MNVNKRRAESLEDDLERLAPCYQIVLEDRIKYVHIEGRRAYGTIVYLFGDEYKNFSASALEASQWLAENESVYYIEEWGDSQTDSE